jgi:tRNA dimethylallyltransferase
MTESPLIIVVGPTGAGKSAIALRIAAEFGGEVVNCDSLQIYRYFDIGTAKLPAIERRGIPHHLIDVLDPDQGFTGGEYSRRARPLLAEITARHRVPVVAGGTGFYLKALIEGLFPGPERDDALRQRLSARETARPGSLARVLRRLDPEAARRIHANDLPKLIRALEVRLLAHRPVTEMFREGRDALSGYQPLTIGLDPPRDQLYAALDRRAEAMFADGLVEEVSAILARGFDAACKPFESHGYKQALQLLRGELSPQQAIFYTQRNTRRYAKRQMTWFRQQPGIQWFRGFGDHDEIQTAVAARVQAYLGQFQS